MNRLLSKILLGLFLITFIACSNEQEDKLKEKFSEEIKVTPQYKKGKSALAVVQQYIEMEQNLNLRFVNQLQELVDNSFEKKLEKFVNEEMEHMDLAGYYWKYIVAKNEEEKQRELKLKADKYFNNLDTQQEVQSLYNNYVAEVKKLRSAFPKKRGNVDLPKKLELDIPNDKIEIKGMDEYVKKYIKYCNLSELDFGIFTSSDEEEARGKFFESLRKQHKETSLDYQSILNKLDKNTVKFYEKYK